MVLPTFCISILMIAFLRFRAFWRAVSEWLWNCGCLTVSGHMRGLGFSVPGCSHFSFWLNVKLLVAPCGRRRVWRTFFDSVQQSSKAPVQKERLTQMGKQHNKIGLQAKPNTAQRIDPTTYPVRRIWGTNPSYLMINLDFDNGTTSLWVPLQN